ncbi:MAG: choice-of-anchor I family protein [Phototrophicaceae bacterium]|jgi:hypothetical protein
MKRIALLALLVLVSMVSGVFAQDAELTLTPLGTYATGIIDDGGAEIVTYIPESQQLVVVNSGEGSQLDFINISDPSAPTLVMSVDMTVYGGGANSVDYKNGIVAAGVEAEDTQAPGVVVFLSAEGEELAVVEVGALPDMVVFTPDGSKLLVAGEGEPSSDYTNDPEGTIAIIDVATFEANLITFGDVTPAEGVRVFGPNATAAQDFEPEYIAVSPDGTVAAVTLQENNAVAIVDVVAGTLVDVIPLGYKDHSLEANALDANDEDGAINIQAWPVMGMYLPDGIAAYEVDGEVYFITANEGDARDYDAFAEESRLEDVTLDPEAFPNAAELQAGDQLARLNVTTTQGDTDGDGDFDVLYNYGGRSFTVWNSAGELVYDSGSSIETITAELAPELFNSEGTADGFDSRSDNKGPEPETVVIGTVNDVPYAFVALERISGIIVYNISDPAAPTFAGYVSNTIADGVMEEGTAGDIAPEGLKFIPATDSPTGNALLAVANEVSGTTTVYEIQ